MGYDKDTPRKHVLASRPVSRAPLTPKIAGSAPATPSLARAANVASSSSVTVSTPLARRATGQSLASSHGGNGYANYDSASSPVPAYLNNVTPRSGSRQNRVDSTTPNGTPVSSSNGMGPTSPPDLDAKFFYASEARPSSASASAAASTNGTVPPSVASMGPLLASPGFSPASRPPPTFYHANGRPLPLGPGGNTPATTSTATLPAHLPPPTLSNTNLSPAADLSSKFVHANGAALEHTPSSSSVRRTPVSPTTQQQGSRPLSPVKLATMATYPLHKSMSFPVVAQTSAAISSVLNDSMQHRPSVPNTLSLNAAASSPGLSVAQASPTSPHALSGPGSPGSVRYDMLSRQRSNFGGSIGSNSSADGHSRKGSLTVADPPTVARLLHASQPGSEVTSPVPGQSPAYPFPNTTSSPGGGQASAAATSGLAAILQAADDLAADEDGHDGGAGSAESHGENDGDDGNDSDRSDRSDHTNAGRDSRRSSTSDPGHPGDSGTLPNSQQQHSYKQVDELVAIARRERKVQDLEITNASLEAINRSLERQLRKQKNELRQFRRLSRSGRLSLAPLPGAPGSGAVSGGSRITSSSTVEGPMQDLDHLLGDDASSVGSDKDDSDREDFPNELGNDRGHWSDNNSENDGDGNGDGDVDLDNENLTRRKRDECRLQLDLAQHHQLLVDSQKMNQSIKRCMKWTEALIQEGQKALAFEVRVSEVQLGGRVLAADEVEEREQQKRNSRQQSERASLLMAQTQALLDGRDDREQADVRPDVRPDEFARHGDDKAVSEVVLSSSSSSTAGHSTAPTPAASSSSSSDGHDDCNEKFSPVSRPVRTVRFDDLEGTTDPCPPPLTPDEPAALPAQEPGTPSAPCRPSSPPPLPDDLGAPTSPPVTAVAAVLESAESSEPTL
ncbi:hypothetical protein SEPCBS119000_002721 [Sporothrix epigloea]|uniref:Uncharacterized protein n=1 Tax=Sporothrix epigloea TaxID=1892477 RepID=A0ABP0DHN6_9PEZI